MRLQTTKYGVNNKLAASNSSYCLLPWDLRNASGAALDAATAVLVRPDEVTLAGPRVGSSAELYYIIEG